MTGSPPFRYRLPLRIRRISAEALAVVDAGGITLACIYFAEAARADAARRPTEPEAIATAQIIARALTAAAGKAP